MKVFSFILMVKKCLGEARWSRFHTFEEKVQVFKILLRLRFLTEFANSSPAVATQKIFGFTVSGSNYFEILYLFREIFMRNQYHFKCDTPSPKIIDGGANIGMALLFFKKNYPHSQVMAFEPNPVSFRFLERNVRQNNLQGVEVFNSGLSGKEGVIDFHIDKSNSLISSIDQNRGGGETIKVTSVKLSRLIGTTLFDFAKIDIEGAELEVIKDLAATNTIHHIQQFIFEYHHNMVGATTTLSEFLHIFEQSGFSYTLSTSVQEEEQFQDILIRFVRK